ncbi:MAG TPA: N-acetylmuramoyl-L-alanine amidase [Thermoanaerobaculia bacterium]|nr:N-acetylmuramoyl-L-alanine amidase [Thermoanaerobaculia bacterium]
MGVKVDDSRRIGPRGRWVAALLAVAALALPLLAAQPTGLVRAKVADGTALLTRDHQIFLEVLPRRGEGLYALSRRLCGTEKAASTISAANGGQRSLKKGVKVRVPLAALEASRKVAVLAALFPEDRADGAGWRHKVRRFKTVPPEPLVAVANWFTGSAEHTRLLASYNERGDRPLAPGEVVMIPAEVLAEPFRQAVARGAVQPPEPAILKAEPALAEAAPVRPDEPVPLTAEPAAQEAATAVPVGHPPPAGSETRVRLDYGRDSQGEYAIYRLRAGEALYSSVVVRFTGRLLAADVNALAEEIAQRSVIADVTDIPVGYRVKIPLDLLLPEHLPVGHPRRAEWEARRAESDRFANRVEALGLDGVTVILDAGHGGRDVGASFHGVWESIHVYDIMLRVRRLLGEHTSARVLHTTQDGSRLHPEEQEVLSFSRGHRVLTDPPYAIEDGPTATNLRWYLANSLYRREVKAGLPAEKVVFLSIHADSLHPSLRGAMVYIPGAELRGGTAGRSGPIFEARREYTEQPRVSFSWQSRIKSEGLSRDLAEHVIAAFRSRSVAVHAEKPVREKIIRRRSQYVPAVLRYNEVPAKVLVEVCNLANEADRRLLQTRAHRQRIAESIVEGLLTYYGYQAGNLDLRLAATAAPAGR